MRQNLIITNAMAIAQLAITKAWTNHVNVSLSDTRIEVVLYFDLHDENVESIYKQIKKSTSFKPEYRNPKFYDSNFETLKMTWEF